MQAGRRFTVSGRVQGVYFRDSTRHVAVRLGIVGHAINLDDGDVEIVAYGEDTALDQLGAWLREGPPLARVAEVRSEPIDEATRPAGFKTG